MFLHDDIVADIQSQTCPATDRFGRKEGIENFGLNILGNPWPIICNLHHHRGIVLARPQDKLTPALHGIDGVVNDVGPDLIQLAAISLDTGQIFGILPAHGNPGFQFGVQNNQGVFQVLFYIYGLYGGLVHVSISFERFDNRGNAIGPQIDLGKQTVDRIGRTLPIDNGAELRRRELFRQRRHLVRIVSEAHQRGREFLSACNPLRLQPLFHIMFSITTRQGIKIHGVFGTFLRDLVERDQGLLLRIRKI
jgi:hypothetical protein